MTVTAPITTPPLLDAAAFSRLDDSIQRDIDAGLHYGASVLVAHHGEVVHRSTLGTVAPGRSAQDDDRYLLMSMSKAFTATLVLRAIDHGRFGLDTRVAELIPAFASGGKATATIRHLLNHTSGLPFGMVPPQVGVEGAGDLAAKAAAISAIPASFAPGTRCLYTSGLGYDLLGYLLVLTDPHGRSFQRIMQEDLFQPLGMTDTSFGAATDEPRRVPVSFTPQRTTPASPTALHLMNNVFDADAEVPSGNAYATADDVLRFTEMLRGRGTANGHRVLSAALFNYARQNHTGDLVNEAFTFEVLERGLPPFLGNFTLLGGYVRGIGHMLNPTGHTASPDAIAAVGGASTSWMIDPDRDLTVVFLSAGFVEGLSHISRVQRINDLALAALN